MALAILVVLNCMVLLGRLWPEGAPPFAPTVDIVFLVASLGAFVFALVRSPSGR
ncbi:MAG: hypothetical protein JNK45_21045 [Myxococcales bacterium]|nr:hypothetical protein [Myxococcales bacterium]